MRIFMAIVILEIDGSLNLSLPAWILLVLCIGGLSFFNWAQKGRLISRVDTLEKGRPQG
jgi:hypothetical protein